MTERKKFLALVSLGYGGSMIAFRPTLMVAMPTILRDLGLSHADGGVLLSTCQLWYMIAKPVSQAVSDGVNPTKLLLASEISTCVVFSLLPLATTLRQLQVLVAALMICQAPHVPAAFRLVTSGFAAHERGTAFSVLNAAANAVSCALPLLVTTGILYLGSWTRLFSVIGAAMGAIALVHMLCVGCLQPSRLRSPDPHEEDKPAAPTSIWAVASTGIVWILGLHYALLYFVRMGVEGWIGTYLLERSATASAGSFLFWWQLGGVFGSSVAGPIADRRAGYPAAASSLFAGMLVACAAGLRPLVSSPALFLACAALGGCCMYAIRVLLTLSIRLHFSENASGKADAITNGLGELGGAVAGVPLIQFVQASRSWDAYNIALTSAAALLCALHVALLRGETKVAAELKLSRRSV